MRNLFYIILVLGLCVCIRSTSFADADNAKQSEEKEVIQEQVTEETCELKEGNKAEKKAKKIKKAKKSGKKRKMAKRLNSCTVTSVNAEKNVIIVKDKKGNEYEVEVTDKTKIKKKKEILKLPDIKAGQRITVYYSKNKKTGQEFVSTIRVLKDKKTKKGKK